MLQRCAMLVTLFALPFHALAQPDRELCTFVSPGGPWGIWKKNLNRRFPVEKIVKDLAEIGVTDIYFPDQVGRGGPFLHPTAVEHAKRHGYMGKRDFLEEVLVEGAKYGMDVWLMWTTPGKEYPDTDIHGLNDPRMITLYCDLIDEVGRNYGHHKNLVGMYWHELDCTEAPDTHDDDVAEFAAFCQKRFGAAYPGDAMPKVDPEDVWWRRHFLYRIHVMNTFVAKTKEVAEKHDLRTSFCTYTAEAYSGQGWRWGYDTVELEKLCEKQWFAGYAVESRKAYQEVKGAWIDFGPSYKGQILSRNYSYAMHGRPLSYFEYRGPVYVEEMRKYYSGIERFNRTYGDFYTGYRGMTQQEVDLFLGMDNITNWTDLMMAWQGGTTPAKVAVAVNVTPFIMKHPVATGVPYKERVNDLMVDMTRITDVDGVLLGSQFSLLAENLRRYDVIVVPQDMGDALTPATAESLRLYVKAGGALLVVATPIGTARDDLTGMVDLSGEFCGIRFQEAGLPGYMRLESGVFPVPEKKRWAGARQRIEVTDAEVLVRDAITEQPVLTRKGTVWFSALGYSADLAEYFRSIILRIAAPPVLLEDNSSVRILEGVRKGNAACFALWEKGTANLKLDTKALGLQGPRFEVKDIVTGATLTTGGHRELLAGIPIEIKYPNQPHIVAVGSARDLSQFSGIYASDAVFEGMTKRRTLENPEVVIKVPTEPGLKVGVYHGSFGVTAIISTIAGESAFNAFALPRLDEGALAACDVVVISKTAAPIYFKTATDLLRKWVEGGGRLLLGFDAVGYRAHPPVFPELGQGFTNPKGDVVTVASVHPVTTGLAVGETFVHGYADHVQMTAGKDGSVLVNDEFGKPVVIAGSIGKGRVVLHGMITGYTSVKRGDFAGETKEPEGGERTVFLNAVTWLGQGLETRKSE
ncbi:MAG: hypothetical protein HOJ57_19875 [Lentisphaerae bacterium]|mgnify:FL=1|jgi:hypothetical protein|nr:hypothetical protein [Lentisphaerota bacterium]MBT4820885.1 hypothetical protein [Lentisphaerota bacterium]MBT5608206.1 hypothetical protein [Lentisphaerota bacterium]MBT7058905.1 hypothetical protein [Lentisphaerota bacterium]